MNKISSESKTKKAITKCTLGSEDPQLSGHLIASSNLSPSTTDACTLIYMLHRQRTHQEARGHAAMPPWPCSSQVRLYPMHLLSTPYSHLIKLPIPSSHEGRQCNQIGFDTETTSELPRNTRPRLTVSRGPRSSSSVTITFNRTWMNTGICRQTW